MKILIFSSYFLPHKGGVENYVHQTAKRLVKKGHKVWVITCRLSGMKKKEKIDGIQVLRVPSLDVLPDRYPVQLTLMSLTAREVGDVDVVMTHTRFYPITLAGGFYAHFNKIPWLHVEHGTKQVSYKNPLFTVISRTVDATTGRWVLHHADIVANVSQASCRFAQKFGARKCIVIYNGVDTKFFKAKKRHKGINIAFIGRLIKEKGVQDLLKATKGMKANVTIIGKGPHKKYLTGMGGKFVGEKNPSQIRDILSKTDILVNPSYAEGLPTSVLEAGAMSLAVVATDVGGTKEIITDGKNGYLVKPGNVQALRKKITTLAKSKNLRERFGKALQKTVRSKFDWNKITDKLEKVLKSL